MIKTIQCTSQFSCFCYVLQEEDHALFIDPGFFSNAIERTLLQVKTIDGILLTHGHFDHIDGVEKILSRKIVPVYAMEDLDFLQNPHYNASFLAQPTSYLFPLENLNEGTHTIGPFTFEVFLTPGHSPGSAIYYFKTEKALFVGDVILGYSTGRTDLKGGSSRAMEQTLKRLVHLPIENDTLVYSGHEKPFSWEHLKKYHPSLKENKK